MRTAILILLLVLAGAGAALWMTGRVPPWLRPDFQAARDDIQTKTRELESTQSAVIGLTRQLRSAIQEADAERQRARDLAETATVRASEVLRLRARLLEHQGTERSPAPRTLAEGVQALAALGY